MGVLSDKYKIYKDGGAWWIRMPCCHALICCGSFGGAVRIMETEELCT